MTRLYQYLQIPLSVQQGGTGGTTSTGTGALVLANSPALVTPNLGVPSAITLTNANPATNSVLGAVKPDGTTITNSAGAISVTYGTSASTAAQGNDSRITGAAQQTLALWTPSDQSGAGLTFTGVNVSSTRLGNLVFCYGRLTYPTTADTSSASIGGLPVTSANQNYALGVGSMVETNVLTFPPVPQVQVNSTKFNISNGFSGAAVTNVQLSGATIIFSFHYPIT